MKREPRKNRRNMPLYARVLCAVAREGKTAAQVAEELRVGVNTVHRIFRDMHGRVAYVGGYLRRPRGRPVALWRLGQEPDAPRPEALSAFDHQLKPRALGIEMTTFCLLVEGMLVEPLSMRRMLELTGCGRTTLLNIVRVFREAKVAHVGAWERPREQGAWGPCYCIKPDAADVAKPRPLPRTLVERRYHAGRRDKLRQARIAHALAANSSFFSQSQAA